MNFALMLGCGGTAEVFTYITYTLLYYILLPLGLLLGIVWLLCESKRIDKII